MKKSFLNRIWANHAGHAAPKFNGVFNRQIASGFPEWGSVASTVIRGRKALSAGLAPSLGAQIERLVGGLVRLALLHLLASDVFFKLLLAEVLHGDLVCEVDPTLALRGSVTDQILLSQRTGCTWCLISQ